ncbi:hypothetical protein ACA910_009853 [Epithemia clementina (nom. ined.)]
MLFCDEDSEYSYSSDEEEQRCENRDGSGGIGVTNGHLKEPVEEVYENDDNAGEENVHPATVVFGTLQHNSIPGEHDMMDCKARVLLGFGAGAVAVNHGVDSIFVLDQALPYHKQRSKARPAPSSGPKKTSRI